TTVNDLIPGPRDDVFRRTITSISANGLTRSVQRDTDGDGFFDHIESTHTNIDGTVVTDTTESEVLPDRSGATIMARSLTTVSADGRRRVIQTDTANAGR